ncbi:MAG: DUF6502 family protein [Pseudomonadota bacterium]
MTDETPDPKDNAFGQVLRGLLRPLVRALIAQGMTAPALYRIIKRVYVEVAERDFRLDDQRPTDSRISMLTGVHRRDVRSFREDPEGENTEASRKVATFATVLGRWLASPETTDGEGRPLPLPRAGRDGPSFEALVEAVSRDIRPRTVLDELVRQGLVSLSEDGETVELSGDAFLGPADLDQKVYFFAENVGDHIAAAADNLLSDDPPFMERAVYYNRLRSSSVDVLEGRARALATEALVDLNRLAHDRQAEDLDADDGTHRFRFGVFFYRVDEAEEPSDQETASGGDGDERN